MMLYTVSTKTESPRFIHNNTVNQDFEPLFRVTAAPPAQPGCTNPWNGMFYYDAID